jgi:hypothetical protein
MVGITAVFAGFVTGVFVAQPVAATDVAAAGDDGEAAGSDRTDTTCYHLGISSQRTRGPTRTPALHARCTYRAGEVTPGLRCHPPAAWDQWFAMT